MKCIIIEDQPPAQRILKKYIEDLGTLELQATFSNAVEAMAFLQSKPVDLIFLDIHLPKISGIDFLKTMPQPPAVILTTAFPDYALESYELDVVDYLLKPFTFQRFVKAVSKAPLRRSPEPAAAAPDSDRAVRKELFIKSGYEHIKVDREDIGYIQSDADYTEVVLPDQKILSAEPLRYWMELLPADQFVRIHKSFIVNVAKIAKVSGNRVFLTDGAVVPIGRAYKEEFAERFLK